MSTQWKLQSSIGAVAILLLVTIFYPTILSMVDIWIRSETFTHAFLIAPISLWLIWEKRETLAALVPKFSLLGVCSLFGSGLLWLLGTLVDALVVQQCALVLMLISLVWGVLGTRIAYYLIFPLFFLLFMVPAGEDLVPPMMEFTANFTVDMVRLSGIPVYREGLFFMLPSGNWSVVEACSGIRYLIASVTLGCLYAYVTYTKWWKRVIFILISIIVPIIANGLRAYMIVMLGHMSDMTVATGVDHLVYGWVFFGVVIFILIQIGSFFKDTDVEAKDEIRSLAEMRALRYFDRNKGEYSVGVASLFAVLTIAGISIWPLLDLKMKSQEFTAPSIEFSLPDDYTQWQVHSPVWDWHPVAPQAIQTTQFVSKDKQVGSFYVDFYPIPNSAEMINSSNSMGNLVSEKWRIVDSAVQKVILNSNNVTVNEYRIKSVDQELLIWSWYQVGGQSSSNKYYVKLAEGLSRLLGGRQDKARVSFAIAVDPAKHSEQQQRVDLQVLVDQTYPQVQQVIDQYAASIYGK